MEGVDINLADAGGTLRLLDGAILTSSNATDRTVSKPVSIQRGTDTLNNLTQPGFNGHISDHFLVYVDLMKTPG